MSKRKFIWVIRAYFSATHTEAFFTHRLSDNTFDGRHIPQYSISSSEAWPYPEVQGAKAAIKEFALEKPGIRLNVMKAEHIDDGHDDPWDEPCDECGKAYRDCDCTWEPDPGNTDMPLYGDGDDDLEDEF